ncbi:MAG: HAD hydrolase family protein [Dehalococcoidia bacterium]|nr:HAD hydrolase family protein [Dehalococcoidia bacterium]
MNNSNSQTQIRGLFLDYDGTIAPPGVTRLESRVAEDTASLLHHISKMIPVGIITTKDLSFILPRTLFANAWCTIGGLEMRVGDTVVQPSGLQATLPHITRALEHAKHYAGDSLFIEEKRDSKGQTVAFCVDWRNSQKKKSAESISTTVRNYCQALPLEVVTYGQQPFFDVYPCPIDKGKALEEMKRLLNVPHGLMYLGDSKVDNPAFRAADISIGVLHEESVMELECDYYIKFVDVEQFFRRFLENDMVFDGNFAEITARK